MLPHLRRLDGEVDGNLGVEPAGARGVAKVRLAVEGDAVVPGLQLVVRREEVADPPVGVRDA